MVFNVRSALRLAAAVTIVGSLAPQTIAVANAHDAGGASISSLAKGRCADSLVVTPRQKITHFLWTAGERDFEMHGAQFADVHPMANQEGGSEQLKVATWAGRKVTLKAPHGTEHRWLNVYGRFREMTPVLREALFAKILSDLGLGPQFFGIAKIKGVDSLVSEYIPNARLNFGSKPGRCRTDDEFDAIDRSVRQAVKTLTDLSLKLADFQFLVGDDNRVYVIDGEHYSQRNTDTELLFQDLADFNQRVSEQALEDVREFFNRAFDRFSICSPSDWEDVRYTRAAVYNGPG